MAASPPPNSSPTSPPPQPSSSSPPPPINASPPVPPPPPPPPRDATPPASAPAATPPPPQPPPAATPPAPPPTTTPPPTPPAATPPAPPPATTPPAPPPATTPPAPPPAATPPAPPPAATPPPPPPAATPPAPPPAATPPPPPPAATPPEPPPATTPPAPPPAATPPAPPPAATPPAPPPASTPPPPPPAATPPPPPPAAIPPAPPPAATPPPPPPASTPPAPPPASTPPPSPPAATPPSPAATPPQPATPPLRPPSPPVTPGGPPPTPPTPERSPPPPPPSGLSPPSPAPIAPASPPKTPVSSSPPPPPAAESPPTPSTSPPPPPMTPKSPASPSSSSSKTGLYAGIAAGSLVALALLGVFLFLCFRRRRRGTDSRPSTKKDDQPLSLPLSTYAPSPPPLSGNGASGSLPSSSENPMPPFAPSISFGFSKSNFSYEELTIATNGFSDANFLGSGGFGNVYKGILDGKEVAMKQLKIGSGQGDREFKTEVEIISRVHHRHLVSLVGYCISRGQRILVYEYVPNKTLEFHLHGQDRPTMDWTTRFKIALGSAKGLAYLHEDCNPRIIHRDIKAANILLDFNFEPKVADFGLAKFQSEGETHISTRVVGTFGYLAPEYVTSGKLTEKSDVFSFGVTMLELITGRRPIGANSDMDDSLVGWARPLLKLAVEDGNSGALIDPRLEENYNPFDMTRLIACAAACVRQSAQRRPQMGQVVRYLQGEISLQSLNAGIIPGQSAVQPNTDSAESEQIRRLRRMAFDNETYESSEFSEDTGEMELSTLTKRTSQGSKKAL